MTAADTTAAGRLTTLLSALGASPSRPTAREDGLSETVDIGGRDKACITAAGDDTAVITIVTTTERGRKLLAAVARSYVVHPGGAG